MREPRRRAGLALEPSAGDPLAGEQFDRDLPVEVLVTGLPDGAEGAGAQSALEAVAVEDEWAGVGGRTAGARGADRAVAWRRTRCAGGRGSRGRVAAHANLLDGGCRRSRDLFGRTRRRQ